MAWDTQDDIAAPVAAPVSAPVSGAPNGDAPDTVAKANPSRPLSLLAERLGALEQSLTVVASEIGVSGMPQFKHLDPQQVYAEAARHASQAARQAARQTNLEMDDRTRETAAAAIALSARLDSELHRLDSRIDQLADTIGAVMQRFDALQSSEQQQQQQRQATSALDTLGERLAALEDRMRAQAMQESAAGAALQQRLDALAAQLPAPPAANDGQVDAEWPFAGDPIAADGIAAAPIAPIHAATDATNTPTVIDAAALQRDIEATLDRQVTQTVTELEARLMQRLEERLERISAQATALSAAMPSPAPAPSEALFAKPAAAAITAADIHGLQQAIAAELAAFVARKSDRNEPWPLLAERGSDINPLVITAAERAIVRLTHRIEKLENPAQSDAEPPRRSSSPRLGSRSGRSLMGRLFEG